jgi:hypothetical protein
VSNANVAEQAIQHRILAVKSLNEALSEPPKTRCERDARMAAALALAFQSSHLQDGMAEYVIFREQLHVRQTNTTYRFLTMVRGCNLIAGDVASTPADSAFYVSGYIQPPQ